MTDEQFAALCAEHPDLYFEVSAVYAYRHRAILRQLDEWARGDGRGGVADSSGGFVLPNGARRAPDAAWTLKSRVQQLDPKMLEGYWHLCPDFVIEVRSPTDRLPVLRAKMQEWIENGAQLAWLVEPDSHGAEVYRPNREVEMLAEADSVRGEGPVAGFVLSLAPVWNPLG